MLEFCPSRDVEGGQQGWVCMDPGQLGFTQQRLGGSPGRRGFVAPPREAEGLWGKGFRGPASHPRGQDRGGITTHHGLESER